MIKINGSDGGGQILRTALSLSMVTGKGFHMTHIRGGRSKPGLMRQHLTCVRAATEIADAATDGAEMHSRELLFNPGAVRPGDYEFSIGSAGSTTLLLQTVLPALAMAAGKSSVRIHGGTHNPMAPSADFIANSFLPELAKLGPKVKFTCERIGFAPAGGGSILAEIEPALEWKPLDAGTRGEIRDVRAEILSANLRSNVANDELKQLGKLLDWEESCFSVREVSNVDGQGNVVVLEASCAEHCMHVTAHGELGKSAAKVATDAAKSMLTFLNGDAAIGSRLADQLLLPMALAGEGKIRTVGMTNHLRTNMRTIEQFLDVEFGVEESGKGVLIISL